jgi:catechol 2,3-dioxygenase-like lactoylglutathione lyase family enzyme
MPIAAKYVHTNLIARDWQALAHFYQEVLGCVPVPPERDFAGEKLEAAIGIRGAHLQGVHLRLPGLGAQGPTLELFQYDPLADRGPTAINRPGFAHIAFSVDDVAAARQAIIASGGATVGEIVTLTVATGARVTFCYVTDPEGNILELQSWST